MCEHGRQRHHCKDCEGSSFCEHKRRRTQCKECKKGQADCAAPSGQSVPKPSQPSRKRKAVEIIGGFSEAELDVQRHYPMIWTGPDTVADIPEDDAAIAYVMFGDSHYGSLELTEAERAALQKSFQSVAGELSTQVVWARDKFELPCGDLRRWLSTGLNIWSYLPEYRDLRDSEVWFTLGDEHDQPEDAYDFSLSVSHNLPTNDPQLGQF